jgi:hypothetical protein
MRELTSRDYSGVLVSTRRQQKKANSEFSRKLREMREDRGLCLEAATEWARSGGTVAAYSLVRKFHSVAAQEAGLPAVSGAPTREELAHAGAAIFEAFKVDLELHGLPEGVGICLVRLVELMAQMRLTMPPGRQRSRRSDGRLVVVKREAISDSIPVDVALLEEELVCKMGQDSRRMSNHPLRYQTESACTAILKGAEGELTCQSVLLMMVANILSGKDTPDILWRNCDTMYGQMGTLEKDGIVFNTEKGTFYKGLEAVAAVKGCFDESRSVFVHTNSEGAQVVLPNFTKLKIKWVLCCDEGLSRCNSAQSRYTSTVSIRTVRAVSLFLLLIRKYGCPPAVLPSRRVDILPGSQSSPGALRATTKSSQYLLSLTQT